MKKLLPLLLIIVTLSTSALADGRDKTEYQPFKTQYIIGLNGMVEASWSNTRLYGGYWDPNSSATFNYGASFEARLTRHSGIETGLYCRTMNFRGRNASRMVYNGPGAPVHEEFYMPRSYGRYLSIPLLYKFYSRVLNVAVGFNYDILIDELRRDDRKTPRNEFGVQLKVTKDIKLYKGLIFEPFVQLNQRLTGEADRFWFGGGVGVKYRF